MFIQASLRDMQMNQFAYTTIAARARGTVSFDASTVASFNRTKRERECRRFLDYACAYTFSKAMHGLLINERDNQILSSQCN